MATRDEENNVETARSAARTAKKVAQRAADRAEEFGERIESEITEVGRQVRSEFEGLPLDENTIPDAFRGMPKLIRPRIHAWLDVATTGYFVGLGIWCATRGKIGPAIAAFVNAGMVATVSALTDYDGDGNKPISFKLHGTLDAVQATTAALGPVLHGFTDEPEAKFFYGQAANEVGVIATTDWDEGMPAGSLRKAA